MIKNLGLIPRRGDLSRSAFREHYELRHAPLALRHLRGFHRYVRNYVVDAASTDTPFDSLSEFWYQTQADLDAVIGLLTSPDGQVLREDEARFMDRAGIRIVRVEESLLFGAPRATEVGVVPKHALLLMRAEGSVTSDFLADVQRLCAALLEPRATGFTRLQLDLPVLPDEPGLALDAVLTAWPAASGPIPFQTLPSFDTIAGLTRLQLEGIETPPGLLRN